MAGRPLEADAIEVPLGEGVGPDSDVRPLPESATSTDLDSWRGEVKAIAVVAAGGIAAGAAAVAAVSAARSRSRSSSRASLTRRIRRDRDVVASRSFLVDVHVLNR